MQFEAEVIGISKDGSGIIEGPSQKKYFVFGVWPGDKALFEVSDQKHPNKKFGYAHLIKLISGSKDRVENPCPHWGITPSKCQSCSWLFVNYGSQSEQKIKRLKFSFSKFAHTQIEKIEFHASAQKLGYRNRLSLKTDGKQIGMVSKNSHVLAPIKECLVANEKCNTLLKKAWSTLPNKDYLPPKKHKYSLLEWDDSSEEILLNKKTPFRQANTEINQQMKNWVLNQLKQISPKAIVELFCGDGNFTEIISERFNIPLYAFEGSDLAIQKLNEKKLKNCNAKALDLFKRLPKLNQTIDTLLLDPPRLGFKKLEELIKSNGHLEHILYISCDSDTLCRDIYNLLKDDWRLENVSLMDQFPQTPHFETLVYLRKIKTI
ncbi:MAG: class I SAM-dependent RNA methyltransferase [Bacteriovoracaceae bacterium]